MTDDYEQPDPEELDSVPEDKWDCNDIELTDPSEFEHHLVVASVDDCDCNMSHEVGDVLWSGNFDPREDDWDIVEWVKKTYDVKIEYRHND